LPCLFHYGHLSQELGQLKKGAWGFAFLSFLREAILDTLYGKSSYKDVAREKYFMPITVAIMFLVRARACALDLPQGSSGELVVRLLCHCHEIS
jgi:hypothetical protein